MATAVTTPARTLPASLRSPLAAWHLLSLDAPTVAAVWTAFVAHAFRVALPWTSPAALALAVWLLYAADRVSDAAHGTMLQERHRFHHQYQGRFSVAALCVLPLLGVLIVHLPRALRTGWLLMVVPMGAYVAAVHVLHLRRVPKEVLVACFFATAVVMPTLVSGRVRPLQSATAAVVFGVLCWINCVGIARWEHTPAAAMDPVTAWLSFHFERVAVVLAVVLSVTAAALVAHHQAGCGAVCAAAASAVLLLLLLERSRFRLSANVLRALADAALLTPLLLWPAVSLVGR